VICIKFATIIPTDFISNPEYRVDNYHLLLAHLIKKQNKYTSSYKKIRGTKILDNSFYEERKEISIEELIEKAELVDADYIILPEFAVRDERHLKECVDMIPSKFKIAGIVVGRTLTKAVKDFKTLNLDDKIDLICIPFKLPIWLKLDNRTMFLERMEKHTRFRKDIHLLGLEDLSDLYLCKKDYVLGVDSTLPFKVGYYNNRLAFKGFQDSPRPKTYFDIKMGRLQKKQKESIHFNLSFIWDVLKNED